MVEKHKVNKLCDFFFFGKIIVKLTQFFSAPTAYRMLMQFDNSWVEKYDKSSLRYIMTAGENCNLAAWSWLNDVVGEKQCKVRVFLIND